MKHLFIGLLFAFMFSGYNQAIAQTTYKVKSQHANVKNKPSTEGLVVGVLRQDTLLSVIGVNDGWASFSFKGKTRYVSATDIEKVGDVGKIDSTQVEKPSKVPEVLVAPSVVDSVDSITSIPDKTPSVVETVAHKERGGSISTVDLSYTASSFKDVKGSGCYGASYSILPLEIAENFYFGAFVSPFNFNFGLVAKDFTSDLIKFGPALGYRIASAFHVTLPLVVLCYVFFHGSETKTAWGIECAPSFYLGKSVGVFGGPTFSMGFSGSSTISCGFRAGLYISL